MICLIVNVGSSTVKLAIYSIKNAVLEVPGTPLWEETGPWLLSDPSSLQKTIQEMIPLAIKTRAIKDTSEIFVIGHRVVHGGSLYEQPVIIDENVEANIASLGELAPLHTPGILQAIDYFKKEVPKIPQVAVFDTSFHATMPETAKLYPGPYSWKDQGIIRYGFHGISHHYCGMRSSFLLQKPIDSLKIVSCHIGNGVSITAIDRGRSVDTTMGFTPLEGVMMGTRCGSVDPAIVPYLEKRGISGEQVLTVMNRESGLLGISGVSGDMREILKLKEKGHQRGVLAFDMYAHSLIKSISGMLAVLKGADVISFTGGVGEHMSELRQLVCEALVFCGVAVDVGRNSECKADQVISRDGSSVAVLVIKAQEDWAIAIASASKVR
jgi:acetate kinase